MAATKRIFIQGQKQANLSDPNSGINSSPKCTM